MARREEKNKRSRVINQRPHFCRICGKLTDGQKWCQSCADYIKHMRRIERKAKA